MEAEPLWSPMTSICTEGVPTNVSPLSQISITYVIVVAAEFTYQRKAWTELPATRQMEEVRLDEACCVCQGVWKTKIVQKMDQLLAEDS